MDRNEGNLLVTEDYRLIPIDHGLCIPINLDIEEYDLCWMSWPQTKKPIVKECLDYILSLDPLKDI